MDIAIFIGIGILVPKALKKLNINVSHYIVILAILALFSLVILVLSFGLFTMTDSKYSTENSIPLIPFVTTIFSLTIFGYIFIKKNKPIVNQKNVDFPKTLLLLPILSVFSLVLSKYAFMLPVYTPEIFNSKEHLPGLAVTLYLIMVVVSVVTISFSTRLNQSKLSRELYNYSIVFLFYLLLQTTIFCLILLYGLIGKFEVSYPYHASIITIGFVPILLLFFNMSFRNDEEKNV